MNAKDLFHSKVFCPAAWNNLYVDPQGNVGLCSIGPVVGNINTDTFDSCIKNNPIRKEVQQAMIAGEYHSGCSTCYNLEETQDAYSLRKHYKQSLTQLDNLESYDITTGTLIPTGLDLRYDNTCQNACVYCYPGLSSRWAKELGVEVKRSDRVEEVKKFVFDNLSNVKEVYLAGGEPLVNKDFGILLDALYEVNPNCKLRINSNIKNIQTPVYESSKRFKNLQYTISVESVQEQFEYIRYPQKWDSFTRNVKTLIKDVPKYNFNMVLNIMNLHGLFDSLDYLFSIDVHENSFIITHAHTPNWANINHLPDAMLGSFVERCKDYQSKCNPKYSLHFALEGCINFIEKGFNKDIDKVRLELEKLDIRRNLNSRKVFPYIW